MSKAFTLQITYYDPNGVVCELEEDMTHGDDEEKLCSQLRGPGDFLLIPTEGSFGKLGRRMIPRGDLIKFETVPYIKGAGHTPTKIQFPQPYRGEQKIKAIKLIRTITSLGLKDAKLLNETGSPLWYTLEANVDLKAMDDVQLTYEVGYA